MDENSVVRGIRKGDALVRIKAESNHQLNYPHLCKELGGINDHLVLDLGILRVPNRRKTINLALEQVA